MDEQYFKNYAGQDISYENMWEEFSLKPKTFMRVFDILKYYVKSVFDVGAASGVWLETLHDFYPEVKVAGIEIYKPIIKSDLVKQGDIRTYKFDRKWDVIYFNGLAYIEENQLAKILKKIHDNCNYFVARFEYWDSLRYSFPKGKMSKIYEKNLKIYQWWLEYFCNCNFLPVYYKDCWILKSVPKVNTKFQLQNARKFYEKIEYRDKNRLFIDNRIIFKYDGFCLRIYGAKAYELPTLVRVANLFAYSKLVAVGNYNTFVPGWNNMFNGNLELICEIL